MFGIGFDKKKEPEVNNSEANEESANLIKDLTSKFDQVMSVVQNMQNSQTSLEQRVNGFNQPEQSTGLPETTKAFSDLTEEDYEDMEIKDILNLQKIEMEGKFETMVSDKLKPFMESQQNLQHDYKHDQLTKEINTLETEKGEDGKLVRPDFRDWVNEMKTLSNENSKLKVSDLYHLSKARNPGKAGELSEKYNPKPKKDLSFGGMKPNLMNKTTDGGDLSVSDAADKAIGQAFGDSGDGPINFFNN